MSHYNAIVLIDPDTDPKAEVARIIAPYFSDRETNEYSRVWDWWRIGGRWDGLLLTDRKAWEREVCMACHNSIGHQYSDAHQQPDRNVVPSYNLPEDLLVYSVWADGEFISASYHLGSCPECTAYFESDDEGNTYKAWQEHSKSHPWDKPDEVWIPEMRRFIAEHGVGKLAVCIDYHN